ncbi:cryptochrome/photolyase family protein [Mucilaginibacter arboris]|uniref:Deoxyribodipyrimidine photo-lyase n=1 Tax=Mucilaginibacter arboris TaxID=2682090 RepID=A0A7K1SWT1_9SPHI|nr:deoxyribodipyrimidine photo-lyase [Mucilaginibacter arboris]MVN21687.1 deoxyribodipyrimidine photo-lyase [Mucilaginibacter arboris]
MPDKQSINIFWLRRDLRLNDNAALYHALKSGKPVLPLFIFDTIILDKLEDKDDARVTFIYQSLIELDQKLKDLESSVLIKNTSPKEAWVEILEEYNVDTVFTNQDYEPYARQRDQEISQLLAGKGSKFCTYKDQVIFDRDEIMKADGTPYTVFTPYSRKWKEKLNDFYLKAYPVEKYLQNLLKIKLDFPSLQAIGFETSTLPIPGKEYRTVIADYAKTRDFPALQGTSRISHHLRFGTLSIRELATAANQSEEKTWLNELIWRDFYAMILWHFPQTIDHSYKSDFDKIEWRNNEQEFEAWCKGKTGYPLVDAGMRQLNTIGWMHNRLRMVTASFLSKHLLIDWRWGEHYFARKLLDYDMSSNVGGWQWAAGSGTDAAPFFRIFSPAAQTKRFDPKFEYIKKWVPEYLDPFKYPAPIVDHQKARERCLAAFKKALNN